jgi:hypothetical protein
MRAIQAITALLLRRNFLSFPLLIYMIYPEKQTETDCARLEAMTDKEIDTYDIPPLDESFFAYAELRMPKDKIIVNVGCETSK